MNKEILSEIAETLKKYYFQKNTSFECIGITVKSNNDFSYKIYNIKNYNIDTTDLLIPNTIYEFIKQKESENNNIKFFGFSERYDGINSTSYSVTFSVKNDTFLDEKYKETADIIQKTFETKYFPLFQIGYLINSFGILTERKYYYTLNQNKRNTTADMRMNFIIENKQRICSFIQESISGISYETIEKFINIFVKYQFRPFMFGINENQKNCENKVYFIFNKSEYIEIQKSMALSLLKEIDIFDSISDCFDMLYKNNLFLRGFSLSCVQGKPIWRLYFYPVR